MEGELLAEEEEVEPPNAVKDGDQEVEHLTKEEEEEMGVVPPIVGREGEWVVVHPFEGEPQTVVEKVKD